MQPTSMLGGLWYGSETFSTELIRLTVKNLQQIYCFNFNEANLQLFNLNQPII